ncbi:hypothetical protein GCM10010261_19580 [Streptomyces pilosus]|nr:hypothetical protein GCM10010261_19580 [Streptomyces pilosus]
MGKRQSRPWIVSDGLWSLIEPLLPEPPPKQVEGGPRVPDRQALCGILFVLHTGIQWGDRLLPRSAARRGPEAAPARSTADVQLVRRNGAGRAPELPGLPVVPHIERRHSRKAQLATNAARRSGC